MKIYNIYSHHGLIDANWCQTCFLFKKVLHPRLDNVIGTKKAKIAKKPSGTVTYTTVPNHLWFSVSEQPDVILNNCRVSGVASHPKGIFNSDGSINTGHQSNCIEISHGY